MIPFAESCIEVIRRSHDTMKQALRGLPDEALDWILGPEMNSLNVLITHTAGAERYWIGTMIGKIASDRVRTEEFEIRSGTVDKLVEVLNAALAESVSVIARLGLEDLEKMVQSDTHGREFQVGWSLLHALEHTANHVGHIELTRQLWNLQGR